MIGERGGPPIAPLNLVGDLAGGGLMLAFGTLTALYERERLGKGQVVDAAMVDGAALLATFAHWRSAKPRTNQSRTVAGRFASRRIDINRDSKLFLDSNSP